MLNRRQLRSFVAGGFIVVALAFALQRGLETPEGKDDRARDEVAYWTQVLTNYCTDNGYCPANEEGLAVLVREGYVRQLPTDPWGRPFGYAMPGPDGKAFEIWSGGADGKAHLTAR